MFAALSIACALALGTPAPPPAVTPPAPAASPSEGDLLTRVRRRLPTPMGWVGVVALSASSAVAFVGTALAVGAGLAFVRGRALRESFDLGPQGSLPPTSPPPAGDDEPVP